MTATIERQTETESYIVIELEVDEKKQSTQEVAVILQHEANKLSRMKTWKEYFNQMGKN